MRLLPRICATTEERFRDVLSRPGAILLAAPDVYDRLAGSPPPEIAGLLLAGTEVRRERLLSPGTVAAFDPGCFSLGSPGQGDAR